ncbi:glycosyltransferase family 1 protein [Patescibacteria group bacterium]|nr:glycosyltransferase family 1 protein [Patescibacteria group bacterium]
MFRKVTLLLYSQEYSLNLSNVDADFSVGLRHNSDVFFEINFWSYYKKFGENKTLIYIKDFIKNNEVDYVFVRISGFSLSVKTFKEIGKDVFLTMLFHDSIYFFDIYKYYAQIADLVIDADPMFINSFRILNIKAINMIIFDKEKYKNLMIPEDSKNIDVSFVGVAKDVRAKYIDRILNESINLKCFGSDFPGGYITFDKMIDIFNHSKINLSLGGLNNLCLEQRFEKIKKRNRHTKSRPWEIAMCGGFVLTEYMDGIEDFFDIGKEIDVYFSEEEMIEKINFYLKNPAIREEMAKNAHERAVNNYDCRVGLKRVFAIIADTKKTVKIAYLDRGFLEEFIYFKIKYFVYFFSKARILPATEEVKNIFLNFKYISIFRISYLGFLDIKKYFSKLIK